MESVKTIELLHESAKTRTYIANKDGSKKKVILKVLKEENTNPKNKVQFFSEYDFTHDLDICGIRKALDKTIYQGEHALVLEYIDGETLEDAFIQKSKTVKEVLEAGAKVAHILSKLHQQGIIHKDLNPRNVLYTERDGKVYIIDFNISSRIDIKTQHLGNPELLEGTIHYISPEQTGRMNRVLDYRSDLYSLGVSLYELLTGLLPLHSDDVMEMLHQHIAQQPTPPHLFNQDIPKVVSDIVLKLLAKNAEDRYQSAAGLEHDLNKCVELMDENGEVPEFELGEKDFSTRFQIPEKLYGRDKQVQQLMKAFESASSGQKELMLISGLSGTGKSALVSEVHKPITGKNGLFISGKFDQFQRNNPYLAISQAIKSFCDILITENEATLTDWRERILEAVGENGGVLTELVPELEWIIGKQPEVQELGANESQGRLNYVFKNFISAIARPEHPLVIFIDDVQWADTASLNLLRVILSEPDLVNILVLLSYRHNEVSSSHPFQIMREKLPTEWLTISDIKLENLSEKDVSRFVADTLRKTPEEVSEVAELIYEKTGGNAFFVKEFLISLHDEQLISLDYSVNSWNWDIKQIRGKELTDNVVDLLTTKARKLPDRTQKILQLAAFDGNEFSIGHILSIAEETHESIAPVLKEAMQEGVIIPLNDNYKLLDGEHGTEKISFKFAHDRLQQVFYNILGEESKGITHVSIARLLIEENDEQQQEELIFELANHFNEGLEHVTEESERIKVAEINLKAAQKARLSSAYDPALKYATTGLSVLTEAHWDTHQELMFYLHLEKAENEHQCGNDDEAETYFEKAIKHASGNMQSALASEKKVHFYANIGKFKEAFTTGRDVLREKFNVKLPLNPPKPALIVQMLKTRLRFRGTEIRDVANLPEATDENVVLSVKLIAAVLKSAYQIKPELAVASSMVMVNLCMKKGNTKDSAIGYLVFGGIFLGAILGIRKVGYEFGLLARDLVEKYNSLSQKSEVTFVSGYFATSWLRPMTEAEEHFQKAYEYGLETGDIFHTGTSCCTILQHNFMRGVSLPEIESRADSYLSLLKQLGGNSEAQGTVRAIRQAVRSLQGKTSEFGSFNDDTFSEEAYEEEAGSYVSQHFAQYYYLNKMIVLYLSGDFEEALAASEKSASKLDASAGMLHSTEHFFYHGLINAALASDGDKKYIKPVKKALKKFSGWARQNPENFEAKKLILEAELLRITGHPWDAARTFIEARKQTAKDGYEHLAGIIYEQMTWMYNEQGNSEESYSYLKRSDRSYVNWGAEAKHEMIRAGINISSKYTQTIQTMSESSSSGTTTVHTGETSSVDVNTIVKLSQTLSGEMVLSDLLDKVMRLVIENAGAQHGYLLLREGQVPWTVQAVSSINQEDVEVMQNKPLTDLLPGGSQPSISEGIVNYVTRTGKHVILRDATNDGDFTSDPYIQEHKPKSVLCAPLIYKGEMTGILYLENNLANGVFSNERMQLVDHLSSQIAISIQNAMLYSNLQEEMKERQRSEEERIKIAAENERRSFELEHMRDLQLSMLPQNPPDCKDYEFATYMKTATEVGGDYYDFLMTDNNGLNVIVGDATGHGMGSGVLVTVTKATLNAIESGDPSEMLQKVSQVIRDVEPGQYKMALNVMALNGKEFKLAAAAMPPMYIYRAATKKVDEILVSGILLGTMIQSSYELYTGTLEKDDMIVFVSDGLPEYANSKGDQMGYDPLKSCIQANGAKTAAEMKDALIHLGEQWSEGLPNDDDITIVVIKKK